MKKAMITGITGQDGSYLAEFLLDKNYEVHGLIRRASTFNTERINHLYQDPHEPEARLFLHYADLTDGTDLSKLIRQIEPDEIYNLAAQSHVRTSFEQPVYTGNVVGLGTARLLESVRETGIKARFYQASSSEMFGGSPAPQSETTPFNPVSPYAAAKLYAHNLARTYRQAYGIFISCGILFNHESPRRGETFVSRKISRAIARIKEGLDNKIYLGTLKPKRDWGYAPDYVEAMWLMLQQDKPDDFVIATGETHTVQDFLEEAFGYVGLNWRDYYVFDERYLRPNEVEVLQGDYSKANEKLNWKPKTRFEELVRIMVDADIELLRRELEGTRNLR